VGHLQTTDDFSVESARAFFQFQFLRSVITADNQYFWDENDDDNRDRQLLGIAADYKDLQKALQHLHNIHGDHRSLNN